MVNQKIRPPRYLAQISIWMIGLGILLYKYIRLKTFLTVSSSFASGFLSYTKYLLLSKICYV